MSVYVKGDINPVAHVDAEAGVEVRGGRYPRGRPGHRWRRRGQRARARRKQPVLRGGGADIFGLGDGTQTAAEIGLNLVADFNVEEGDTIGLIGDGLDVDNFSLHIIQAFNGAVNAWT